MSRHYDLRAGAHPGDDLHRKPLRRVCRVGSGGDRPHAAAPGEPPGRSLTELELEWKGQRLLTDPQINILLGTSYLHSLLQRYDEHGLDYALAAYNVGPTKFDALLLERGRPPAARYARQVRKMTEDLRQSFFDGRRALNRCPVPRTGGPVGVKPISLGVPVARASRGIFQRPSSAMALSHMRA